MKDFSDRLEQVLDYLGITPYKLAREIGTSEAVISNARSGKNKPSYDLLSKILNKYKVLDANWLVSGEGSMIKNDYKYGNTPRLKREHVMLNEDDKAYTPTTTKRNVTPTKPESVTPTVTPTKDLTLPKVVTVDKIGEDNVVMVPVAARAGYLSGYGDPEYISELPTYHIPRLQKGTFRAFEVEGHSMTPTITHGDIIFGEWVESFNDINDDRVYVIVTKTDGILVKRVLNRIEKYGFLVAKSDAIVNRRQYPNINIPPHDVLELWQAKMYLGADFSSPSDIFDRLNDLEAAIEHLKSLKAH